MKKFVLVDNNNNEGKSTEHAHKDKSTTNTPATAAPATATTTPEHTTTKGDKSTKRFDNKPSRGGKRGGKSSNGVPRDNNKHVKQQQQQHQVADNKSNSSNHNTFKDTGKSKRYSHRHAASHHSNRSNEHHTTSMQYQQDHQYYDYQNSGAYPQTYVPYPSDASQRMIAVPIESYYAMTQGSDAYFAPLPVFYPLQHGAGYSQQQLYSPTSSSYTNGGRSSVKEAPLNAKAKEFVPPSYAKQQQQQ